MVMLMSSPPWHRGGAQVVARSRAIIKRIGLGQVTAGPGLARVGASDARDGSPFDSDFGMSPGALHAVDSDGRSALFMRLDGLLEIRRDAIGPPRDHHSLPQWSVRWPGTERPSG